MAKFKRYDSYKNSGVEWLGEIPSHWEILKLKFVSKIETGNSISDDKKSNYECVECESHPYIATKDINYEYSTINYDNGLRIPKGETNFKIALPDSILICVEGGSAGKKIAYTNQSVCYVNKLASIQTIGENVSKFLYYVIKSHIFKNQFDLSINGLIGGVSVLLIKNFCAILPPKDEQEKIASYLDEKIAKIDASISGKEKFIELLKEQKQIIINDAVTKGLNKNAKFKNSGVEWLGEIPSHWEVVRLGSLGIFSKGNGISRNELVADGIPAILYGDIYTKYNYQAIEIKNFISTETSLKAVKISENDILLTGSGETKDDIGKCVVFKGKKAFAGGDIIIFKQDKNNSTFLAYSLNSSYSIMQKTIMAKGEIIVHIYSSMLKELLLPLPPKDEQEKIVEYIENKISKIDKLINLEQECIKSLKEYKASLIDSVVTGKVKV